MITAVLVSLALSLCLWHWDPHMSTVHISAKSCAIHRWSLCLFTVLANFVVCCGRCKMKENGTGRVWGFWHCFACFSGSFLACFRQFLVRDQFYQALFRRSDWLNSSTALCFIWTIHETWIFHRWAWHLCGLRLQSRKSRVSQLLSMGHTQRDGGFLYVMLCRSTSIHCTA